MPTIGPFTPGTLAEDAAYGTLFWTTPSNAGSSNNVYATTNGTIGTQISRYLKATNFSVTGLPSGAIITQIVWGIERKKSSGATAVTDDRVRPVIGGTVQSTELSAGAAWSTTEAEEQFTQTTGLPTKAEAEASNFGLVLAHQTIGINTASVDLIRIVSITYDDPLWFEDTFTDADGTLLEAHTADTGQAWINGGYIGRNNDLKIVDNTQGGGNSTSVYIIDENPPWDEYVIEWEVTSTSIDGGDDFVAKLVAPIFRIQDTASDKESHYAAHVYTNNEPNTTKAFVLFDENTFNNLGTSTYDANSLGHTYSCMAVVTDESMNLWVDGVHKAQAFDVTYPNGRIGIRRVNGGSQTDVTLNGATLDYMAVRQFIPVDMAATCGATSGASARMNVDWSLTAPTVPGQSTLTAAAHADKPLVGTVTAQSAVAEPVSGLDLECEMQGRVDAVSTAVGILTTPDLHFPPSPIEAVSTCVATLEVQYPLTADDIVAVSTAAGSSFERLRDLAGTAAATSGMTGQAHTALLVAGTITCQSVAAAHLNVPDMHLSGSAVGQSGVAGTMSLYVGLAGSAAGIATAAGHLNGDWGLSGAVTGQSSDSARMNVDWVLSGSTAASATADAAMNPFRGMQGRADAVSVVTASAGVDRELQGHFHGTCKIDSSHQLSVDRELSAAAAAQSFTSGASQVDRELVGTVAAAASAGASLDRPHRLSGSVAAQSAASAYAALDVSLDGHVSAQSMTAVLMSVTRELQGAAAATSTVSGTTNPLRLLAGVVAAQAAVSSTVLFVNSGMSGAIAAHASPTGLMNVDWALAGRVPGESSVRAALTTSYLQGPYRVAELEPYIPGLVAAESFIPT